MKKWMFITLISLIVWSCGGGTESSSSSSDKPKKANLNTSDVDAMALFKQTCVACHGANGEMAINGAKKFSESMLSLEERVEIITNGSTKNATMIAYKSQYSPKEIQALAEYTIELGNNAKAGE